MLFAHCWQDPITMARRAAWRFSDAKAVADVPQAEIRQYGRDQARDRRPALFSSVLQSASSSTWLTKNVLVRPRSRHT